MMKKITLILFTFFFVLSYHGQAQITIGDNTTTTSFVPINSCYGYSYSQQIFYQSDINDSGNITSVSFYVSSLPSSTTSSEDWTIYMGQTTKTEFTSTTDWVPHGNFTEVYSGNVTFSSVGSWMTITLDTPFVYDGTSNLVIAVDENQSGWNCSVRWGATNTSEYRSIYYRSDSTNPNPASPPTATGRYKYYSDIQLNITSSAICLSPSDLDVTAVTSTTADLSWIAGDSETLWNIEVVPSGTDPIGLATSTGVTNPYTITGLQPNTAYDFYVQADCGVDGYSIWKGPYVFVTACATNEQAPWSDNIEGHEESLAFTNSRCWTASSANAYAWNVGSGSTPSSSTGPSGASDGQKYFYIEAGQGATADSGVLAPGDEAMLETLPIDVSLLTMPVLSFDYHMYGSDVGSLYVDIHDGTAWVDDVFVFTGQQQASASANWEKIQIMLTDYAATGTIQVRFRAERGNGDKGDIAIDAVSVLQGATCLDPAALKASNVTDITADISWLDPNGSSWNIEVVEQGSTPSGTPTYTGVTSPYTLTGLTGLTSYEVYLQTDCGAEGQSNWVGPVRFRTACVAFPLPVCENFDSSPGGSSTNPALPDCWSFIDSGSGYGYVYQWRTELPFYMSNSSDISGDYILVSPLVSSLSDGNNWVTFDVDGSTGQELIVGTLASPADPTTFTAIQTITLASNSYESHQVVIPAGTDGYVGLKHGLTGTYDSFYIDNICIEAKPACINPNGVVVSSETDTSAEVSWTVNSGETSWNIEVVPEGSTPTGTPTYAGVTANPYIMTGLLSSTKYEVYIQADCGVDGTSDWSNPVEFATLCAVVVPDYLQNFSSWSPMPTCWEKAGSGDPTEGPSGFGSASWYQDDFANDSSKDKSARINIYSSSWFNTLQEEWLISPSFDLTGGNYELEYKVALTDGYNPNPPDGNGMGSDDEVLLLITIDDGATWQTLVTYNQSSYPSHTGDLELVDLSAYAGETVRFAFWGSNGTYADTENYDFFVGDFEVRTPLLCSMSGVALGVQNVTTTGADFIWTPKANQTLWNVELVTQGTDPSGTPTDVVTGLPYSKTGLQPNTTYEYYVQADCGTDGVSRWVGPYTFTTACEVVVAPYTETFEDVIMPECWSVLDSDNSSAWSFDKTGLWINDHTTSGLTNYAWVDGANNETGEQAILTSPMIDVSALTTPSLDFYTYSYNNADTAVNEIVVEFYDGTNWNTLLTQTSLLGNNWHRFVFDLSTYTISGDVQFRFKVTGSNTGDTSNHPVVFDDIVVDEMPNPCLTPEEVMFSNYQLDAVEVTWLDFNDPQIGQWTIEYGPQGFTQGSGTTEVVTSLPHTITGLTSGVKYDLYIQGECSATSSTDWIVIPFAPLVEGATCEVAIDIPSLPYTFTGNTEDYQNHYRGTPGSNCGTNVGYLDGNEVVYTFTATTTELVDFSLTDLDGYYASLFVYEACADIGTNCVAGITAGPSQNDIRIEEFEVQAGQEYYVVVSSWLNPTVGFTLDIIPFDCATFEAPEGEPTQEFTTGQTIADLTVEATRENNVTLNWYASDGVTPIADTATLVDGETYYVSQTYNGCEGAQLAITVSEIDCSTLAITNTVDASVNCAGVMELSATASGTGSETYWYDAPTGGNVIGIGSTFETPYLTQTTSFWASEVLLEGSLVNNIGEENWTYAYSISTASNYWRGLYFRADSQFTINKVDVYDASSGGGSANIELYNTDTDALVASTTVTLPGGGSSANPVKVILNLNFVVPGPGNYKLVANDAPAMKYESDWLNSYLQYPMPIGTVGEILETGYAYTSGSNTYEYTSSTAYYYFYNWQITEGISICESPREEVIATVNQTGDEMVTYTDLPYTHTENTATYGNNFSGSAGAMCPGSLSLDGNDVIYHYTADPANDDILTIELSRITHPNTSMYIYSSCADIGVTCIAGVTTEDGASKISIEDYYVTAGDEFFIVISSTTGSTNYTLDISKVECGNVPAPEAVSTTPYYIGGDVLAKAIPILELTSSSYNEGYIWYADAGLTTPIDPATEVISSGATYYVTQTIFACEGDALAITPVEFDCSGLNVSVGSDIDVCSPGGDIVLTATPSGTGSEVVWYSDGTGGIIIGTGPSITVNIDRTTSFWVTEVFLRESATLCATQREELVVNVNYTPTATPTGLANQEFCGGARLSDIEITGTDIVWYENESSETPLPVNTVLEDGKVYYATQTLGACESLSRLPVSITVTDESDIPVGVINQGFELGSGAMVSDLDVQGVNLQWYADEYGLNPIADTTLLEDQTTYYVSQTISGLCESELLGITVHVDGLGTDDPTFAGVTYYPNPMKDRLTITNNNGVIDTYELYSLLGQRIEVKQVNADNYTINVSHLASGTYFIKVNIATKSTVFKLIKE